MKKIGRPKLRHKKKPRGCEHPFRQLAIPVQKSAGRYPQI